jgi:hypothetical protein
MTFGKLLVSWVLAVCLLAISAARISAAQSRVLACVADTALFEQNTNHNLGGMEFLPVGRTPNGPRGRALYKFTVADVLPAGSIIRSATLELEVVGTNANPRELPFAVHRVLAPWGEGNKIGNDPKSGTLGAPAEASEATWYARFHPNLLWSQPGGAADVDYVGAETALEDIPGEGRYLFSTDALVRDVQLWLDNSGANFGWLVKIDNESLTGTALGFASREDITAAPVLRVEYEPPGQQRPRLENVRQVGGAITFEFQAEANRPYVVFYSTGFNTWLDLALIPPGAARTVTVTDPIGVGNRFYRVSNGF